MHDEFPRVNEYNRTICYALGIFKSLKINKKKISKFLLKCISITFPTLKRPYAFTLESRIIGGVGIIGKGGGGLDIVINNRGMGGLGGVEKML